MKRPLRMMLGLACAVVTLPLFCLSLFAQDQHLAKTTKADHAVVILGYARSDKNCEGITPPLLYLGKPAEHGTVCFRPSKIRLRDAVVGNLTQCLGRDIPGVTVVYLPRFRYVGADTVQYTVEFPDARQIVDVDLTVLTDRPPSQDATPADISGTADDSPQSPGPMPACSALVS